MLQTGELARAMETLQALASHLRIQIVSLLEERDYCVHELVKELKRSQPLISQHLYILRQAGIVEATRHGRTISYRLSNQIAAQIVSLAAQPMGAPQDEGDSELAAQVSPTVVEFPSQGGKAAMREPAPQADVIPSPTQTPDSPLSLS